MERETQPSSPTSTPPAQPLYYKKAGTWRNTPYAYLLLTLALLVGIGLLIYGPYFVKSMITPTTIQKGTANGNTLMSHPYSAIVPGPNCDTGGANWEVGGYFKVPTTSTIETPAAATKAAPTPQVMIDNSTVTTCQQNGLLVQHNDHFAAYAEVFFESHNVALPKHFRAQITASVIADTDFAIVSLGVRNQNGARGSGYNGGYGDNTLEVGVNGAWQTSRYNDKTDALDARLSRGYIQPEKTFTLAAEVDGPRMTFFIDGQKVTTITDITYPDSYGITFGMSDPGAKSPPRALFSHFVYTPLPDTNLSVHSTIATATAQATKDLQTPYTAPVPGFDCDKGGGQWKPVSEAEDHATARCLTNGLAVSQEASDQYIGDVPFYGLDGNFPANYTVKVQIDVSELNGGCAGIMTHRDERAAGYVFLICSDGSWQITRFDSNGNGQQLAASQVAQRSSYIIEATSNGPVESLALDGEQVASVNDKMLTTTDHIELSIAIKKSSTGSAIFTDFVFTPQA